MLAAEQTQSETRAEPPETVPFLAVDSSLDFTLDTFAFFHAERLARAASNGVQRAAAISCVPLGVSTRCSPLIRRRLRSSAGLCDRGESRRRRAIKYRGGFTMRRASKEGSGRETETENAVRRIPVDFSQFAWEIAYERCQLNRKRSR